MAEIASVVPPGQDEAFTVGDRTPGTLSGLAADHIALLDGPVTATLATLNDNGTAQLSPVWVGRDGDVLLLNTVRGRLKDRNLRARPKVTLQFTNPENPYHWLTVYGDVVATIDEDDAEQGHLATENIDDLAETYVDQRPYPFRDPAGEVRVLFRVEPSRVVTFGSAS
jgi:PPOX class probable F420-dependent enzyme